MRKNVSLRGTWLAQSVEDETVDLKVRDSWSQGHDFQPHIGGRVYLENKKECFAHM